MTLTPEQIKDNFDKFRGFIENLGDRAENALALVDHLGERLALCPASARKEYHLAIPGGLVDHSLRVMHNAMKISKSFFTSSNISTESIVLASLLHDIGKCGSEDHDNYLPQESEWHREKCGEFYVTNKEIPFMPHSHRSVYLLQKFNVNLTQDEYVAILTHDGMSLDQNKAYNMKQPILAVIVSMADMIATMQEKLLG